MPAVGVSDARSGIRLEREYEKMNEGEADQAIRVRVPLCSARERRLGSGAHLCFGQCAGLVFADGELIDHRADHRADDGRDPEEPQL